ncbi:MAG: leucine-rich repeat domain-containing protein [Brumimicrobium sp.]|nr:leucine-rich repeat domain-containing protein [Brumimicrobium sp.]
MKLHAILLFVGFCMYLTVGFSQQSGTQRDMSYQKQAPANEKGVQLAYLDDSTVKEFKNLNELLPIKNKIVGISIQNKDLTAVPAELKNFSHLTTIDLSHNKITHLQTNDFSKFPKLQKLYLNDNPISKSEIEKYRKENQKHEVYFDKNQFQ